MPHPSPPGPRRTCCRSPRRSGERWSRSTAPRPPKRSTRSSPSGSPRGCRSSAGERGGRRRARATRSRRTSTVDQPVGGLTPLAQADILLDALVNGVGAEELSRRLDDYAGAAADERDLRCRRYRTRSSSSAAAPRAWAPPSPGPPPAKGPPSPSPAGARTSGERCAAELAEQRGRDGAVRRGRRRRRRAGSGLGTAHGRSRFGRIDCLVNAAGLTDPRHAARHHARAVRRARRGQPARRRSSSCRRPCATCSAAQRAGHDRQRHHDVRARRPALPRALRRRQGRARRRSPATPRYAHRWDRIRINGVNIGWTETEGEDAIQREFHGADDDWLERPPNRLPMGRLGQPDEIADARGPPAVRPQRRGHRLRHRLGPAGHRRLRLTDAQRTPTYLARRASLWNFNEPSDRATAHEAGVAASTRRRRHAHGPSHDPAALARG